MDDPNFGVTVRDPTTGQDVVLSEKDVATIKKLRGGKVPDGDYNLYTEWSDFYRWDKFKGLYYVKYLLSNAVRYFSNFVKILLQKFWSPV